MECVDWSSNEHFIRNVNANKRIPGHLLDLVIKNATSPMLESYQNIFVDKIVLE